jgi:hypothetical protein
MVDINLTSRGRASALPTFALYSARRARREAAVEPFEMKVRLADLEVRIASSDRSGVEHSLPNERVE